MHGGPLLLMRRLATFFLAAVLLAGSVSADEMTASLLARAFPTSSAASVAEIGRGIGIVFSPDLSVPANCRFYEALGFACFESADWAEVLDGVRDYNDTHPLAPVRTLMLETHGTNGNGLKLQESYARDAGRSYISVGGLQERAQASGVHTIVISACNSGRLLRPSIVRELDPDNGDRLFLPATLGIIGASPEWEPERSSVTLITPESSHIETTLAGELRELAPATRRAIVRKAEELGIAAPAQFAISDMLIQILTRDPLLRLRRARPVDRLSKEIATEATSERLFDRFIAHLDTIAAREPN
jgi:hypothetical protein